MGHDDNCWSDRRAALPRNSGIDHRPVEHAARAVGAGQEAAEHRETLQADAMQPAQLGQRVGVIVSAYIQIRIRVGGADFQRCRLFTALVAAAIPDAKVRHAAPPSSSANSASGCANVGLVGRP